MNTKKVKKRLNFANTLIYNNVRTKTEHISVFCSLGDPRQETSRTANRVIVYMDKNTSPIVPKPMNKEQIKHFYNFLLNCSEALSKINILQSQYEIPADNSHS